MPSVITSAPASCSAVIIAVSSASTAVGVVRRGEGVVAAADDQREIRFEGQRRVELGGADLARPQPADAEVEVRQLRADGA